MNKKNIFHMLEARVDEYRVLHPATADMDVSIIRSISEGRSAVQVAMEIPCSESTVYRAQRRVRNFLSEPELGGFLDVLRQHVAEYQLNYGDRDAKSVLEMIYVAYTEYNVFESRDSKAGFEDLYAYLSNLPLKKLDCIIDKVCDIAHYHERDGFTEGVKLGLRLGNELKN